MRYPFDKHFVICTGKRCNDSDHGQDRGEAIQQELKDLNKTRGRKGAVRVCSVSCLDLCDDGPNMIVWPEGTLYSHLTRESAREAYEKEVRSMKYEV